jgi:hypothetical protein
MKNIMEDINITNSLLLILGILLVVMPDFNNESKFNIYVFANSKVLTQVLFINLILFSLFENNMIAILLIAIFFTIFTFDKDNINEGFLNYYKTSNEK